MTLKEECKKIRKSIVLPTVTATIMFWYNIAVRQWPCQTDSCNLFSKQQCSHWFTQLPLGLWHFWAESLVSGFSQVCIRSHDILWEFLGCELKSVAVTGSDFPSSSGEPTCYIYHSEYIFRRPIFSRLNLRLILRQLFTRPNRRPLNKSKSLEVNLVEVNLVVTSIIGPSEYIFRRFKTECGTYFETIFYETKSVLIKVLRRIQLLHPSSALQSTDPRESWLLLQL